MKLGAEPKKVAILGGLIVVALAIFLFNGGGSAGVPTSTPTAAAPAGGPASPAASAAPAASTGSKGSKGRASVEFRPQVGARRGDRDRVDPMTIDPTLKLDAIAKLQNVDVTGSHRSIFDFSQPPAPKVETPKPSVAKAKVPSPIVPIEKPVEVAKVDPPKPSAPPIPMKFFGYVSPRGDAQKRAFFMEGEEIHVVREGDMVKRRYKIVRIGVNSVVVEDTNFPGNPQTLPLEEQPG